MISVVAHEWCVGKRPTLQRQKYLFYASVASLALQVTGIALLGQVQQHHLSPKPRAGLTGVQPEWSHMAPHVVLHCCFLEILHF